MHGFAHAKRLPQGLVQGGFPENWPKTQFFLPATEDEDEGALLDERSAAAGRSRSRHLTCPSKRRLGRYL